MNMHADQETGFDLFNKARARARIIFVLLGRRNEITYTHILSMSPSEKYKSLRSTRLCITCFKDKISCLMI